MTWCGVTPNAESSLRASARMGCIDLEAVNESGVPERVTPADQPGTHGYELAPGGRLAFHTWSQFDRPASTDVVEASARALVHALNKASFADRLEDKSLNNSYLWGV